MKGRLLLGLLAIATIVLIMYYRLCYLDKTLISGFIVLATGIISHVISNAEDILVALFKVGDLPKPDPVKPVVTMSDITIAPKAGNANIKVLIALCLVATLGGCASYSFSHLKGNGTYIYNGIPVTGNVDIWSCIGLNTCPPINMQEVVNADLGSTTNTAK